MDFLNAGFTLFTFRGVRVRVAYSFFILMFIVATWSKVLEMQVCLVITMVISILLHEFGHVAGAWLTRIDVTEVALVGMGGYTSMAPAQNPGTLFVTTIAGPLVNVLLAAAGIAVTRFVVPHAGAGTAQELLSTEAWVMTITNVLLLCFNMLPIYPMDGGLIAQSIVWPFSGYIKSVIFAGMFGTVGGVALAGLGLGLADFVIPLPARLQELIGIMEIPIGIKGQPDELLIFIGVLGAIQSFALYRHGQAIARTRR